MRPDAPSLSSGSIIEASDRSGKVCGVIAADKQRIRYVFRPGGLMAGELVADTVDSALAQIRFGSDGLVTAVAQQFDSGKVLMVAWMNREAVRLTLAEGRA